MFCGLRSRLRRMFWFFAGSLSLSRVCGAAVYLPIARAAPSPSFQMKGFEGFFSPLLTLPTDTHTARRPWERIDRNLGDSGDPNDSSESPASSSHPSQLHPELAPVSTSSFDSIPSPVKENNPENNRELRRRLTAAATAAASQRLPQRASQHDEYDHDHRETRRSRPARTCLCRLCTGLAILALVGIVLVTQLVIHFKSGSIPEQIDDVVRPTCVGETGAVDIASSEPDPEHLEAPSSIAGVQTGLRDEDEGQGESAPALPKDKPPIWKATSVHVPKATHDPVPYKDNPREEEEAAAAAAAGAAAATAAAAEDEDSCWIFMHMDKSGASGARRVATERWRKDELVFDTVQWRRGDGFAADVMASHWKLLHGGCVESLRNHKGRSCKWLTIFRHPIARLLSAYDHCLGAPKDPVCPPTQSTGLVVFAELWGNFAMRQFALAAVSPSAVKEWAGQRQARTGTSMWYLVKEYLARGGIAEDEVLESMLEPVKGLLGTQYAAVGIAQELETTMVLFSKALSMEGLDWSSSWATLGINEEDKQDSEYDIAESEPFRQALENPRIISALRLDMSLYEHAVHVFKDQVAQFGME